MNTLTKGILGIFVFRIMSFPCSADETSGGVKQDHTVFVSSTRGERGDALVSQYNIFIGGFGEIHKRVSRGITTQLTGMELKKLSEREDQLMIEHLRCNFDLVTNSLAYDESLLAKLQTAGGTVNMMRICASILKEDFGNRGNESPWPWFHLGKKIVTTLHRSDDLVLQWIAINGDAELMDAFDILQTNSNERVRLPAEALDWLECPVPSGVAKIVEMRLRDSSLYYAQLASSTKESKKGKGNDFKIMSEALSRAADALHDKTFNAVLDFGDSYLGPKTPRTEDERARKWIEVFDKACEITVKGKGLNRCLQH